MRAGGELVMGPNDAYGSSALIAMMPMSGGGNSPAARLRAVHGPIVSIRNTSLLAYGVGSVTVSMSCEFGSGASAFGCSNIANTPRRSRAGIAHSRWYEVGRSGNVNRTGGVPSGNAALNVSGFVSSPGSFV